LSLAISHRAETEFPAYQLANNKKVDPRTAHLAKQSGSTGGKQLSPTPTSPWGRQAKGPFRSLAPARQTS